MDLKTEISRKTASSLLVTSMIVYQIGSVMSFVGWSLLH